MDELGNGEGVSCPEGSRQVVAFLGPISSYSHQAAIQAFQDKNKFDLQPAVDIDAIFEVVQREEVNFGVVPFENSTNGPVIFTLDNLANRYQTCPDVAVCGEAYVDVHHYLVGHKKPPRSASYENVSGVGVGTGALMLPNGPGGGIGSGEEGSGTCTPTAADPHPLQPRTKPLANLGHVQRLYSHPQAWGQCSAFLSTYLKGVETFDVSSTSRAAEMVRDDGSGTAAAISSEIAARLYQLDVLGKCIEDREDNTTRFFILRKLPPPPPPPPVSLPQQAQRTSSTTAAAAAAAGPRPEVPITTDGLGLGSSSINGNKEHNNNDDDDDDDDDGKDGQAEDMPCKSLVSFTVPHYAPGALANVLDCFRRAGLNLTSVNSRPSLIKPFQYLFFVEFEGHRQLDRHGRVKEALDGVDGVAEAWRWLGSWVSQRSTNPASPSPVV